MKMHLANLVRFNARMHPDSVAVKASGETVTYRQLDRRAAGCAAALRNLGVDAGDRVLFILPNSMRWVVLYQGIMQAGAIPVPVNPLLAGRELAGIVKDCEPKLVLSGSGVIADLRTELSGIVLHDLDSDPVTHDEAEPAPLPQAKADDVAVILYSSGSTGMPKGIELTHGGIFWNVQAFAFDLLKLSEDDRCLTALPLSHVFGHTCVFSTFLFAGAQIVLPDRFDPPAFLKTIHEEKITVFMGVPTMYWTLLKEELPAHYDLSSWKACVAGGQALPEEVHRRFEEKFNVRISEGFGMTEASPSIANCRLWNAPRKLGSAGQPLFGVELRIVNDEGRDVAVGERGEIVVSSSGLARGYFRQPELTARTFRDGWLYSGDIGYLDEDGFLYVVDRKKEMIITGGYNVYPREIEEIAHGVEGIFEVAAIGVPDERLGERIVAFLVPLPGAGVSGQAFIDHCNNRLARYKVPREVRFVDTLPRNATGKIDRIKLRVMGANRDGEKNA
ncbi:MAG: AMP-binding protein [Xanthobacteraceae bacterium]|nr:AMP-binding protein [Xanthobacteraceae bacterium]